MCKEQQRYLNGDNHKWREEEAIIWGCEHRHTRWEKDVQMLL